MIDVIVCGSLHLDIVVDAPHLPRLDETAVGTAWRMVCGGKGGNQAVMAARLGARTAMIGRVGADDFGAKLRANLAAVGVDHSAVDTDASAGSGMSVALLKPDGGYGAVIVSGANLKLKPKNCVEAWSRLGGAPVLILQNEIPEPANIAMAKTARAAGARVVLNAAPARPANEKLMRHVDTLVVNRVEAEMFCGHGVDSAESAEGALLTLQSDTRDAVITLGGDGVAYMARRGHEMRTVKPVRVKVVSTHGAGDCFVGALALKLAAGETLAQAVTFANRMAAKYVSLRETERAAFAG